MYRLHARQYVTESSHPFGRLESFPLPLASSCQAGMHGIQDRNATYLARQTDKRARNKVLVVASCNITTY